MDRLPPTLSMFSNGYDYSSTYSHYLRIIWPCRRGRSKICLSFMYVSLLLNGPLVNFNLTLLEDTSWFLAGQKLFFPSLTEKFENIYTFLPMSCNKCKKKKKTNYLYIDISYIYILIFVDRSLQWTIKNALFIFMHYVTCLYVTHANLLFNYKKTKVTISY